MKKLAATLCLTLAALLLVTGCTAVGVTGNIFSMGLEGGDLPPCPGQHGGSTTKWSDCYGVVIIHEEFKYFGEFKNGEYHGQGTYTWANGNKYVGEWRDGKQHGQGAGTSANGDKYVGKFRDDKFHGQGTHTFADGGKHVGEYRDGKRHGQGTYTTADGGKYVGEWRDGLPNGQGTYTFTDIGNVEEGVWESGCLRDFCIYELMVK